MPTVVEAVRPLGWVWGPGPGADPELTERAGDTGGTPPAATDPGADVDLGEVRTLMRDRSARGTRARTRRRRPIG
ncbi:MAG: hypothetical protein LKI44_02875 [Actinomyces sp.]|jgi:hypothetical protein|nr:hypothetical protein [Actinomyces sp.]